MSKFWNSKTYERHLKSPLLLNASNGHTKKVSQRRNTLIEGHLEEFANSAVGNNLIAPLIFSNTLIKRSQSGYMFNIIKFLLPNDVKFRELFL